jgi:L-glyceraldehyde 3-phosphate reductase
MAYVPNEKRYERIEYRRCGDNGLSLPPISLGTWQNFGGGSVFELVVQLCGGRSIGGLPTLI